MIALDEQRRLLPRPVLPAILAVVSGIGTTFPLFGLPFTLAALVATPRRLNAVWARARPRATVVFTQVSREARPIAPPGASR